MGIVGFVIGVVCGCSTTAVVAQNSVTVDYSSVVNSAASPYLFGGSNEPNPSDQATVYPMLKSVGVKFQRGDIHLDQVLPTGITVAEYQANTNGVANPANWNWGPLSWVSEAKAQGFTTMANILYAPTWLTYSGTIQGVPSNWSVWQDIVTKIVEHEGSSLNYLEILNEPTCGFVATSGSSYGSAGAAADDMYYYAAVAARAGSSSLIIGGDGDCENSGSFGALSKIIPDSRLTSNLLQFVSYHIYSPTAAASDNIGTLEALLANNGRSGLPIFITEWNYNYTANTTDPHIVGGETITYAVMQFMLWSTQSQLAGVDIYSFIPSNEVLSAYEDCSGCDNIAQGFYRVNSGTTTLATQSRAYQLMSVALGLGLGNFKVYSTATLGLTGAQGFINAKKNVAAIMTNDSSSAETATVTLKNVDASGCNFTVYIYTADTGSNTAINPTSTLTNQCITNGTVTLSNIALPSYSAVGVIIN
ncbi:hypothetical protein [Granulicella arctica]|uniref:Glycoside hydrolase family 5 domain-containing protein n=1 Tax=Granulicella arctica TaxID=940613 RepID=A0A7Y9PK00_9BACT|nr:hypothetical protein [Granulicella arctica]NYF81322.1 hypothetical protein [Granulicella arctica]